MIYKKEEEIIEVNNSNEVDEVSTTIYINAFNI